MQKLKNIWHLINATIANIYFKFPSKKLIIIGVTGTDGKTTVSTAIYHILSKSGEKSALISTVGAEIDGEFVETGLHVTTPGPFDIQKFASLAVKKKCKYLILEITSIGLDQFRDFGLNYRIGLITNLSHEHLDYHRNMQNYAKAKTKLLNRSEVRLINPKAKLVYKYISNKKPIYTYSISQKTDYTQKSFNIPKITGDYNTENLIGAAATCEILGLPKSKVEQALLSFKLPKGRMQKIVSDKKTFFIDFGHTPQALESTLHSIKDQYPNKKIITVFGSAGMRDHSKRPLMGKAASKYSSTIIITSEDPRYENQNKIAKEIESGFDQNFYKTGKVLIINDRQSAFNEAVKITNTKNICIFFGKGHEQSMNINGVEHRWSEEEALKKALKSIKS